MSSSFLAWYGYPFHGVSDVSRALFVDIAGECCLKSGVSCMGDRTAL